MNKILKQLKENIDVLKMLSLKFVSSSLRGATAVATNQLGSSNAKITPIISNNTPSAPADSPTTLSSGYHSLSYEQQSRFAKNATLISASFPVDRVSVSEPRIRQITTTATETDLELPPKPKKPITPWVAFVRERKDEVLGRKHKMNAAEMASILAKEWENTDKSRYEREYQAKREEYLKQMANYEESLTNEQREFLAQKKNLKKESKVLRELRKTKPPTLPRNPANFYCIERCLESEIKDGLKSGKGGQVFSSMFKEYRLLNDQEKEKYIALQQKDRLRFREEFNQWYEGVMSDESTSKSVRKQAENMKQRFTTLDYI